MNSISKPKLFIFFVFELSRNFFLGWELTSFVLFVDIFSAVLAEPDRSPRRVGVRAFLKAREIATNGSGVPLPSLYS